MGKWLLFHSDAILTFLREKKSEIGLILRHSIIDFSFIVSVLNLTEQSL